MDFIAICVAILLWLVRPQDWVAGMAGVGFMKYAMLAALAGLYLRPGSLRLKMFFQSPIDYLVLIYLAWIIWTTGDYVGTAKELFPFLAFYYTAALALNTPRRMSIFLTTWLVGLCVVTVFAVSPEWGYELAPGSINLTSFFEGRLALNTWIYNNPNSLGHGVVILIAFAYVWLWWKRGLTSKLLACAVAVGAGYCVYLTESKGAYLCGAAALGIIILFRRKIVVQVLVVILAMTAGIAALKMLPRMNNLNAQEDGIAGRLIIWQMAHSAMVNTDVGEGWKKFEAWVTIPKVGVVRKATHGSYVNVGADLGYPGLFLFLGIIYACGRTVLQARPAAEDLVTDRNQRALVVLLSGYAASAWMIDRAYHTDFFLIAGTIAALHRQMAGQAMTATDTQEEPERAESRLRRFLPVNLPIPDLLGLPRPALALPKADSGVVSSSASIETLRVVKQRAEHLLERSREDAEVTDAHQTDGEGAKAKLTWRRVGILDLVLMFAMFRAVMYVWVEIMTNFISF